MPEPSKKDIIIYYCARGRVEELLSGIKSNSRNTLIVGMYGKVGDVTEQERQEDLEKMKSGECRVVWLNMPDNINLMPTSDYVVNEAKRKIEASTLSDYRKQRVFEDAILKKVKKASEVVEQGLHKLNDEELKDGGFAAFDHVVFVCANGLSRSRMATEVFSKYMIKTQKVDCRISTCSLSSEVNDVVKKDYRIPVEYRPEPSSSVEASSAGPLYNKTMQSKL